MSLENLIRIRKTLEAMTAKPWEQPNLTTLVTSTETPIAVNYNLSVPEPRFRLAQNVRSSLKGHYFNLTIKRRLYDPEAATWYYQTDLGTATLISEHNVVTTYD